jgi:hypothetical protein
VNLESFHVLVLTNVSLNQNGVTLKLTVLMQVMKLLVPAKQDFMKVEFVMDS